jgi:acetyl esterase/lipase
MSDTSAAPETRPPSFAKQVTGRGQPAPSIEKIEDLVAARPFYDLSALNEEGLPEEVELTEVTLREQEGTPLQGELYTPPAARGAYLHLHGGGWCFGGPADCRRLAMRISAQGYVVLNLDYGRAPEHPFPRAVEDAAFAARWLAEREGPIGIGGQSAGANLAAAAILALEREVEIAAALLVYGTFDLPLRLAEPRSEDSIEVRLQAYLGSKFLQQQRNPLVSPIYGDLSLFPPTYLSCGAADWVVGQSLAMTRALIEAGVPVTLSVVEGAGHGFLHRDDPEAILERERIYQWLAEKCCSA